MMEYFLVWLIPMLIILDIALCVKAGFYVSDLADGTGLEFLSYILTAIGLMLAQVSILLYYFEVPF